MGKMGFDIVVSKLKEKELAFCQEALKHYAGFPGRGKGKTRR